MNAQRRWIVSAAVICCLLLTGCATSRSEIKLSAPVTEAAAPTAADAKVVVIRTVTDERVFEQAPRDPSTPSLGFGGAEAATAEVKSRAIGRKRNTYGKALGDVLLENGQTVEAVVRENLTAALQQAGYRVQTEASSDAVAIDVRIKQFWAWFQPGFWAIKLHTKIATDLSVGDAAPISVAIQVEDSRQIAADGAWIEIVDQALKDYRAAAAEQTRDRF